MNAGRIIKKLRQEKGMTQQELADALSISKASVQKYEQGDVLNLKTEMLRKLCIFMNVSPWVFIFPEYVSISNRRLLDDYCWDENLRAVKLFRALSRERKNKVLEYMEMIHAVQKQNEKEE